jgi:hypothetical protein
MCEFWKCQVEGLSKTLKERSDLLKDSYFANAELRKEYLKLFEANKELKEKLEELTKDIK